jgi:hypothetical protein
MVGRGPAAVAAAPTTAARTVDDRLIAPAILAPWKREKKDWTNYLLRKKVAEERAAATAAAAAAQDANAEEEEEGAMEE